MPSSGLTAISTQTTTGTAASINFASIPATYTHLKLVVNSQGVDTFTSVNLRVGNGSYDSGNNYSYLALINDATVAKANAGSTYSSCYGPVPEASAPFMVIYYIWNYTSTNMYKTVTIDGGNAYSGTKYISKHITTWRNTAAINQVQVIPSGANFNSGTTATLFGITGV